MAQDCRHAFEVIVVDDCSKDRTAEVMATFSDPRLRYIRNETNRGACQSANIAFQYARGEYIARLDGDDVWYPWFLSETAAVLDERPEVGLVYGDIHTIDQDDKVDEGASIERPALPQQGNEFVPLLHRHYICAPTMLARRSLWEAVLPYPETLKTGLADWLLTLKMAQQANFCYVPRPVAMYRVHGGGMHQSFVRDRTGERAMRTVLDEFLGNGAARDVSKQEARKIYGNHYRRFGNSYFGEGMSADARRCYGLALRYDPAHLLDPKFAFPLFGSWLGNGLYEQVKQVFNR